jgi:hypothetical protein
MKPYIIIAPSGWLAYRSIFAYLLGRSHLFHTRTWEEMEFALAEYERNRRARRVWSRVRA